MCRAARTIYEFGFAAGRRPKVAATGISATAFCQGAVRAPRRSGSALRVQRSVRTSFNRCADATVAPIPTPARRIVQASACRARASVPRLSFAAALPVSCAPAEASASTIRPIVVIRTTVGLIAAGFARACRTSSAFGARISIRPPRSALASPTPPEVTIAASPRNRSSAIHAGSPWPAGVGVARAPSARRASPSRRQTCHSGRMRAPSER
jgi:hypothetical protein